MGSHRKRWTQKEEKKFLRSEIKYKTLVEHIPNKIFIKDINSIYLSCNENYADDLNMKPEDVVGKTDYDFYPKELAEKYRTDDKRIMETGKTEDMEEKYIEHEEERWVHTVKTPYKNGRGGSIGVLGIFRDITEHKKAEADLSQTRNYLENLLNCANAPIVVWDREFKITCFNHAFEHLTGYAANEVIGQKLAMLFSKASKDESLTQINCTLKGEHWDSVEIPILCKDRDTRIALWNSANVYAEDGKTLLATIAQGMDITERKKAEEALKESEGKWRSLVKNAPSIIMTLDRKGTILFINHTVSGFTPEQVIGKNQYDFIHPKYRTVVKEAIEQVFKTGNPGKYEIQGDGTNGTISWYRTHVGAIEQDGKIVAVTLITDDITERKKAEKVLKESEDKYRSLFSTTPSGAAYCKILVDEDNRPIDFVHLEVNNAWERSIGLKRENVVGGKITEVIPGIKESKTDLIGIYGRVALTGEATNFELYFEPLEKWFTISVYCPCKGYFVAVFEDITKRKEVEEEIKNLAKFPEEDASPVYRTSKEGVLLYANPASRRLILEDRTKIGDKIPEKWIGMIRNAYDSGTKQQKEIELSGRIFLFDLVPVIKGGYVNSYATDITEQKISELKVYESQKKFQSLVETTSDFIWEMDINGIYTYCSPQMERLWGFKPEQMIGKTPFDLLLPGGREQAMKAFSALSKSAVPFTNMEAPSFDSTGRVRFLEISGVPFFDIAGKLCGYRGITRDITERKKAEEKIKQQNIQLKKLDHIKTDFFNVTSHELRTPMAAMKGYLQMLSKQRLGNVTPEQKNALEVVLRNTNRLDNLIQEILDVSQLESGTMKFIPEKTDISKMIEEVTETVQPNANVKNIKINMELEEVPELVIDQQHIKQAIMNLVDNAIKFSSRDSTINLSIKTKKDNVLFEVQDFGRGMPKKEQKKIFERFYQIDSSMDRKFGGVGLGLAISRDIVLVHGGKMWVNSTVGKGSTFGFTLPVKSVINIQKKSKI